MTTTEKIDFDAINFDALFENAGQIMNDVFGSFDKPLVMDGSRNCLYCAQPIYGSTQLRPGAACDYCQSVMDHIWMFTNTQLGKSFLVNILNSRATENVEANQQENTNASSTTP